ncbi:MAG TPA: hypothetical protein VGY96_06600 [Streptosporangiaceae bacterium]|nr:hypothetical protein [Streptosporangiaceae bacterium]
MQGHGVSLADQDDRGHEPEAVGRSGNEYPSHDGSFLFARSGCLASHLARAARTYAARRRALIAGLRSLRLRISGVDAGLHLVADLPAGADEAEVQRRLAEAGLAVDVLGQFSTAPLDRRALVCGYALLPETQAAAAAGLIGGAVAAAQ